MNKPYIVCHMMASVDGHIDCAMTEQLPGVQEYYATLDALEAPTRVSGRVTAELEMAQRPVTPLTLTGIEAYDSGAVWLRYRTVHD